VHPRDWSELSPGQQLTIVKLDPGGAEAARYNGEVVATFEPESWCIVQATWTYGALDLDGLKFHTGDHLLEWFSPVCPFNAFAVSAPEGGLRGWYANVTYPAYLQAPYQVSADHPTLVWHDLFLDLIGRSDGTFVMRDRDELDASGISSSDPALYQSILTAGDELAARFSAREIPFLVDPLDGAADHGWDWHASPKKPNVRGK
jgi:hypothetical protein